MRTCLQKHPTNETYRESWTFSVKVNLFTMNFESSRGSLVPANLMFCHLLKMLKSHSDLSYSLFRSRDCI